MHPGTWRPWLLLLCRRAHRTPKQLENLCDDKGFLVRWR
jgi:hypothetical protein